MDPVTIALLLVVAWVMFSPSDAGAGAATGGPVVSNGTNSPLDPHGAIGASCPPGTSWNGTGCTEAPQQSTDQTAQPIGGDVREGGADLPVSKLFRAPSGTLQPLRFSSLPPPPRSVARAASVHRSALVPPR